MSQIFNVLSIRTDAASQAQIHLRRTFVTFAHENISQQTSHEIIVKIIFVNNHSSIFYPCFIIHISIKNIHDTCENSSSGKILDLVTTVMSKSVKSYNR